MKLSKLMDRWRESWAWKLMPYAKLRMQLPNGVLLPLTRRGDVMAFRELFLVAVYEPFFNSIDQITSFVDLGCNCGFFTAALMSHAQSRGWTIKSGLLIEADAEGARLADALVKLNRWPQIKVVNALFGKSGARETFHMSKKSLSSSTKVSVESRYHKVMQARSLAELCQEVAPVMPELLKVDIEGSEIHLLEFESDFLAQFKYVIWEWHEPFSSGAQVKEFIEKNGLRVCHLHQTSGEIADSPWNAKFGMVLWAR